MSQFNYTIDEFDAELKTLKVTFDDGSWAKIQLREPIPTTEQEVDDVVKHYTATKEQVAARTGTANVNFIGAMVGQNRTAERFSTSTATFLPIPPDISNPNEVIL